MVKIVIIIKNTKTRKFALSGNYKSERASFSTSYVSRRVQEQVMHMHDYMLFLKSDSYCTENQDKMHKLEQKPLVQRNAGTYLGIRHGFTRIGR